MPSISGMRMSMSTTSGSRPGGAVDGLHAVGALADDLDVGLGAEDHPEARADELLVVDQEDLDRHQATAASATGSRARTANPPPGAGPASTLPPYRPTRSRMPTMP